MVRRESDRSREGFTLIEVIVVLAVVASLAAILTPMVVRYVEDARTSRARSDAKVIGSAVNQFFRDVGHGPVFSTAGDSEDLEVLVGPGDDPGGAGSAGWPSSFTASGTQAVGTLSGQLISNDPGYDTSPPSGVRRGQGLFWQGPYIEAVDADPWGHRYVVDIAGFRTGSSTAVFALSAGPNGIVDTQAQQERIGELAVGGDDLVFRIK